MCIGGYIAKFCGEQGIPYDDMAIEFSCRIKTSPSGTAASPANTSLIARITKQESTSSLTGS